VVVDAGVRSITIEDSNRPGEIMKTVYSASNITLVSIFRNILDSHGFRCWIKNEFLSAAIGELPPIECWPQLCVDDADFQEAKRIMAEALSGEDLPPWKCDSCGEEIEGQFAACWKCEKVRPSDC
jgi:hypothetical protein